MIAENLSLLSKKIPSNIQLVAVSKTKPNELLMQAYDHGQRHLGENKVQELVSKHESLPKDINWHFIGHLQRNKVKYIAGFVHLIHGVESLKLLKEIDKQGQKNNRIINVLLQFHIAEETSKFGLNLLEAQQLLIDEAYLGFSNICISGVMGMATFTDNTEQVRNEFRTLKSIYNDLKMSFFKDSNDFKVISMGMSGDYEIAIEEGSTLIRVGSSIFGARDTPI
ncbi:MAG: YggS family pyridoxal phosphate-dependent enzyme [Crocinitomicaceae bacterium]|jgi:pyridoxal phosphate enzyme (YggS family)|nr:YggS family pyridoxal phosphate-dependent enzyme [Flavobacteriales bacterium]MDO7612676.1 YggS family pyridoxal phosphate-dependent enzyme [Crocinitomicaceae bacterium]